jgi:hypothetical protein
MRETFFFFFWASFYVKKLFTPLLNKAPYSVIQPGKKRGGVISHYALPRRKTKCSQPLFF